MVVHLAEELIKAFLTDKGTQALVSCDLMNKRIVNIGYVHIIGKHDDNLIVLRAPPTFGSSLPASGERVDLCLRPDDADRCVRYSREIGDTRLFGFGR